MPFLKTIKAYQIQYVEENVLLFDHYTEQEDEPQGNQVSQGPWHQCSSGTIILIPVPFPLCSWDSLSLDVSISPFGLCRSYKAFSLSILIAMNMPVLRCSISPASSPNLLLQICCDQLEGMVCNNQALMQPCECAL